jgi:hypothetical protein
MVGATLLLMGLLSSPLATEDSLVLPIEVAERVRADKRPQ